MDTDSCVLSFTEGSVPDEYIDLSNRDTPIKTNNKVPGEFKHEFGNEVIEGFIGLQSKTFSFQNERSKGKGIKKKNNGKYEDYYYAVMYNKERIVEECRIQKVGGNIVTIKTTKISLSNTDNKAFYLNDNESCPLDKNLILFERSLIKKLKLLH